jgi:hypothetical protein
MRNKINKVKKKKEEKLGLTNYEETFEANRINQLDQGCEILFKRKVV